MFRGYAFVDWDDTIAENISHFAAAEAEMSRLMSRWLGLDPETVFAHGRKLDLAVARELGLGRTSFNTAWTRCYDELCLQTGRAPDPGLRQELWQVADAIHEREQQIMAHARETLEWLRTAGFELTAWTAGETAVQEAKIDRSGLGGYYHRRVVVPHKNPELLARALGDRNPARTVVIGNSASSDIVPALAVGVLAIHVPAETWDYDEHPLDPDHPLYVRVHSLDQVPGIVGPRFGIGEVPS